MNNTRGTLRNIRRKLEQKHIKHTGELFWWQTNFLDVYTLRDILNMWLTRPHDRLLMLPTSFNTRTHASSTGSFVYTPRLQRGDVIFNAQTKKIPCFTRCMHIVWIHSSCCDLSHIHFLIGKAHSPHSDGASWTQDTFLALNNLIVLEK